MPRETSHAAAARLNAEAAIHGWTQWRVAREISDACGVSLLQAHRLASGWRLRDAVEAYAQLPSQRGNGRARLTIQQLSSFETGRSRPSAVNLDRLCRLYRTRPDRLGLVADYSPADTRDSDDGPATERLTRPPVWPHQDEVGELPGAVVTRQGLGDAVQSARRLRQLMTSALQSGTLGEIGLEQLERTAAEYGYAYQRVPAISILTDCLQDFGDVRNLLLRPQSVESRMRLCRVAAQLSGTAGMAFVALGEHREARGWFQAGQVAAEETGDRGLKAWLYAREAVIPFYYGTPEAARALAERARLVAGRVPCATGAWAPSLEARSLARMGRGRDALRMMAICRSRFEALDDGEVADTAYGYTERQLRWHEGSLYIALGNERAGAEALCEADGMYAPAEYLDRTLIALDRASGMSGAGEQGPARSSSPLSWSCRPSTSPASSRHDVVHS